MERRRTGFMPAAALGGVWPRPTIISTAAICAAVFAVSFFLSRQGSSTHYQEGGELEAASSGGAQQVGQASLDAAAATVVPDGHSWAQLHLPPNPPGSDQEQQRLHQELYIKFLAAEHGRHTCSAAIRARLRDIFQPHVDATTGGIALLMVPTHGNFGDNLLWHAALEMLGQMMRVPRVVCCDKARLSKPPIDVSFKCPPVANLIDTMGDNALYLFCPGGNWGSLYKETHRARVGYMRRIQAELFARGWNGSLVQLPQSVLYTEEGDATADANALAAAAGNGSLSLYVRQESSRRAAADSLGAQLPGLRLELAPDMAFAIPPLLPPGRPIVDVYLIMRLDREQAQKSGRKDKMEAAEQILGAAGFTFLLGDWPIIGYDPERPPEQQRRTKYSYPGEFEAAFPTFFAATRWQHAVEVVSKGKIIISDRLHGAVTSMLSGKRHIIIDNSYQKVTGTRAVAFEASPACTDENVHATLAGSYEEALRMAVEQLQQPFWYN